MFRNCSQHIAQQLQNDVILHYFKVRSAFQLRTNCANIYLNQQNYPPHEMSALRLQIGFINCENYSNIAVRPPLFLLCSSSAFPRRGQCGSAPSPPADIPRLV